ncbi:Zinc finger domain-containing protein [Giardia duodenalis]|uniref:Zinc finger domain-containing protein n=1 Tax=Giardia intestinalis (strain ATCC 50803 / WB clone C6) TaxID=184922 RepID=A8B6V2_GIAIC|nr:Zinc finger domain [Giardia intestinalis]KAE8301853.1 Zinc finger domain-containing protein [Giardia intestinalis]|eukprot:XP_001709062.1 Zinc finger domain [Giardia lamblia ATCC 50803]
MSIVMRNMESSLRNAESLAVGQTSSSTGAKYKTEFCNCFAEFGRCDYGDRCQFAHSMEEFQHRRRSNVKDMKLCTDFITHGYCPYGRRCNFLHQSPDGLVCDTTQPTLFSEPSHIDQSVIAAYNKFLRESRQDEPSSRVVIAHQIKEGPGCSIRFSDTYVEAESLLCRDGETSPDKPGHAHISVSKPGAATAK